MPLYGPVQIPDDIDPSKLLFTSMGCWTRKTTAQSVNNGTLTAINFADGETFDNVPAGFTGLHDTVSNTSRIVMRRKGFWLVIALLSYQGATGTGSERYTYLIKNGVTTIIAPGNYITLASSPHSVLAVGITYASVDTDYVETHAYQTQGSAVNVGDYGAGTFFGAAWIGDNV